MECRWTPETSESDLKGQNSMACGVFYIIEKLLELRCLKWARITHLEIWNTSYGQKKGRESNCQFDPIWLLTRKSRESTRFTWLQTTCHIPLESSWRELQLCFRLHFDPKSARKVMGLQSPGNHNCRDFGSPAGVSGEKSHLDVGPVERSKVYYKGEGGGFP
jgi:hypothetical protein